MTGSAGFGNTGIKVKSQINLCLPKYKTMNVLPDSHLKLHHGLLHALNIKDNLDQFLNRFCQLRLGASGGCQPLHCFLILLSNMNTTRTEKLNLARHRKHASGVLVCYRVCAYLSIVNLQRIELIGILGKVGRAPVVACLLFVHT